MAPINPIRVTERAQKLAAEILRAGDIAIDGTAGKGRDTAFLATYFQFLRFPIGSGSLLSVAGAMMYGAYGTSGQIVGGASFCWGLLMCGAHVCWRKNGAAFNVTLLSS